MGRRVPLGLWATGLGLLLLASVTLAVTIGPADIRFDEVWASILSHLGIGANPLTDLRAGSQRLEDVFRRLTAERAANDASDTCKGERA